MVLALWWLRRDSGVFLCQAGWGAALPVSPPTMLTAWASPAAPNLWPPVASQPHHTSGWPHSPEVGHAPGPREICQVPPRDSHWGGTPTPGSRLNPGPAQALQGERPGPPSVPLTRQLSPLRTVIKETCTQDLSPSQASSGQRRHQRWLGLFGRGVGTVDPPAQPGCTAWLGSTGPRFQRQHES